ncbi:AMP-dependent synthetase and ligase [Nostocoides japonicum T1-X7]|uniref:Acyl-CoA synthetase n=1 Tax=Nostocoides japonicum T1-X7 TaxID=1194083 RepID=A0A077LZK9_9MICO|nr:long-chain fatty acid--CoA ligase [Tetrasphaera japonica]CCH79423.1 AMP-dependent synthetase and ligase [Tetrasphaera japonica T1-X7]
MSTVHPAPATTLAQLPYLNAARWNERPAMRHKVGDAWHDISYADARDVVDEIARGLLALGVEHGDRVAILADTRPEWAEAAAGVHAVGGAVVPIYPSSSAEECAWVLGDSGASVVVCENAAQAAKVDRIREGLPALTATIVVDGPVAGWTSLSELRELGAGLDPEVVQERVAGVAPEDIAIVIYTSGTTGRPKGCVLTHANLVATNRATRTVGLFGEGEITYLYLPMAHVFGQCSVLLTEEVGGVVAFVSGGSERIVADLAEIRPTYVPSVPRVFEKLYAAVTRGVPAEDVRRGLAAVAQVRATGSGQEPSAEALAAAEAIEPILAAGRAVLGGRVRVAISGAAPISTEILAFFEAAGVPIFEGYGLSESAGIGTLNVPGRVRHGSVGPVLPGLRARIAEDGEILLGGEHIFAGYWRNEGATTEVLEDGWLHTGDLGSLDEDGMLTITGRKKDIIITAGGKNITPANLENDVRQSPFVSNVLLHGDRRPYLVALVTLDPEAVLPWARSAGLPDDLATLAEHPRVIELVQRVVDAANARYATVAQMKKFLILPHDFSQESGELTPTLKLKRAVVADRYAEQLEHLYDGKAALSA